MGSFDPLRARLPWGPNLSDENPDIAPLTPAGVADVRLPWLSRFNSDTLTSHLNANPRYALWVPKTSEYVIAERWRRRDDIANIVEVTARKGKAALVRALLAQLRQGGSRLVLLSEEVWNDQPRIYADLGFAPVEKIVFFQRDLKNLTGMVSGALPQLNYRRATPADLNLLIRLDNDSFPWLWWNSPEDMSIYVATPEVTLYIASAGDEPVGYASFTMYNGWAHLDRLAVIEVQQGRRYGAAQLNHVINAMAALGATHVALSTQENNVQSHSLYKGFEFRQTHDSMNIYGISVEG